MDLLCHPQPCQYTNGDRLKRRGSHGTPDTNTRLEEWLASLMYIQPLTQMRIMRMSKIQEEVRRSAQFLRDRLVSWSYKETQARKSSTTDAEYIAMSDVVANSFGSDPSSKDYDLISIKFHCTVITKVQLLFAQSTTSTLALNPLTYGTISSESKWKIEWLNSTSWKRIINLQIF
ncbi:hypothetical protein Tco_1032878 [Tanacetum coccineum]|uniref:Uncharacterized protein n=1 Tax=Tanacetum coccineum TaxID=301880 RepID=A0ABQ5GD27_9ASTR